MAGTELGGQRASATIRARDPDFYKRIGRVGGKKGQGGGVTGDSERAKLIGKLGGRPPQGKRSLGRKQQIIDAKQALHELNRKRGMV